MIEEENFMQRSIKGQGLGSERPHQLSPVINKNLAMMPKGLNDTSMIPRPPGILKPVKN